MISRSIQEWCSLNIGEGSDAVPELLAAKLLRVAREAHGSLQIGDSDGGSILKRVNGKLCAGQIVGMLVAPGVCLEILPKIDRLENGATRINLVRMLSVVFDLKIADGELTSLGHQPFDLLEIFIRLFCGRLFTALRHGRSLRYVHFEDDLPALRGRLNVIRQFTTLAISPQKLACNFESLSVDTPLNQILRAAVVFLSTLSRSHENRRRLNELALAFADVKSVRPNGLPWTQVVLDRTNSAWHEVFRFAQLLLKGRFQTLISGESRGFSLLFEMNVLFEKFVGQTIRVGLHGTGFHATLQGPRSYALSETLSGTKRFMTMPDIVIHRVSERVSIIDTKWKRLQPYGEDAKLGVSQQDVYQLMAYGAVYAVDSLMLLYPHHSDLKGVGLQGSFNITGTRNSVLKVATVDLSNIKSASLQLLDLCDECLQSKTAVSDADS